MVYQPSQERGLITFELSPLIALHFPPSAGAPAPAAQNLTHPAQVINDDIMCLRYL
jgi:hypothetical protein